MSKTRILKYIIDMLWFERFNKPIDGKSGGIISTSHKKINPPTKEDHERNIEIINKLNGER